MCHILLTLSPPSIEPDLSGVCLSYFVCLKPIWATWNIPYHVFCMNFVCICGCGVNLFLLSSSLPVLLLTPSSIKIMPSCSVTKWSTILYILIRITTNATHKVRSVTEQEWIQFSIFVISFQLSKIHFFMTKLRQFFMKFSCLWYCLDSYPRIGTKPRNETIVLACIAKGTESRRRSLGWNICNMQKEHACSLARTAMAEPRTIFFM